MNTRKTVLSVMINHINYKMKEKNEKPQYKTAAFRFRIEKT